MLRRNVVLDSVQRSSPRYALANRPEPSSIGWPCSSITNAYVRDRLMYGDTRKKPPGSWWVTSPSPHCSAGIVPGGCSIAVGCGGCGWMPEPGGYGGGLVVT